MMATVEEPACRPGDVIDGKYEVESTLGAGGMGVVVLARHLKLDEQVAIKLLHSHLGSTEQNTSRFLREARAAVKIKSQHVARVLDVGALGEDRPYIVMEFLAGRDLATWLAQDGPLSPDLTVEFTLQALEAIAEAHALGIVHRDIKPGNLFATTLPGGATCIKVLDFGISKLAHAMSITVNREMTEPGALMGSPSYMSPEQFSDDQVVDHRSDIWSIGATMFELLTGQPAFGGDTLPRIYAAVMNQPLRSVREVRPDVSTALAHVVERCVQKNRDQRYQDVGALALALEALLSGPAVGRAARIRMVAGTATLPEAGLEVANGTSETAPPTEAMAPPWLPPARRAWIGWAAAGTLTAAALATLLLSRREEPAPVASSAVEQPPSAASAPAGEPTVGAEPTEPSPPPSVVITVAASATASSEKPPASKRNRQAGWTTVPAPNQSPPGATTPTSVTDFGDATRRRLYEKRK